MSSKCNGANSSRRAASCQTLLQTGEFRRNGGMRGSSSRFRETSSNAKICRLKLGQKGSPLCESVATFKLASSVKQKGRFLFPGSYRSVFVGQIPQINLTRAASAVRSVSQQLGLLGPPSSLRGWAPSSGWAPTAAFRAQSILFPPERSPANVNLWPAITSSVDVALDGGNSGFSGDGYHLGNAGGGPGKKASRAEPKGSLMSALGSLSGSVGWRPDTRKTSRSSGDTLAQLHLLGRAQRTLNSSLHDRHYHRRES